VGVLAAGGVTALIVGGLLLVSGPGPQFEVSRWLVFGLAFAIGLLFVGAVRSLYRTRRRPAAVGEQTMLGRTAIVRSELAPLGYVSIDGESWKARLLDGRAEPGESVTVIGIRGLELEVRREPSAVSSQYPAIEPAEGAAEAARCTLRASR
ncbi:MAG: NfeD family protein, partial [Dehalococcoidia bacterium]